jgi:hypothetical protein
MLLQKVQRRARMLLQKVRKRARMLLQKVRKRVRKQMKPQRALQRKTSERIPSIVLHYHLESARIRLLVRHRRRNRSGRIPWGASRRERLPGKAREIIEAALEAHKKRHPKNQPQKKLPRTRTNDEFRLRRAPNQSSWEHPSYLQQNVKSIKKFSTQKCITSADRVIQRLKMPQIRFTNLIICLPLSRYWRLSSREHLLVYKTNSIHILYLFILKIMM